MDPEFVSSDPVELCTVRPAYRLQPIGYREGGCSADERVGVRMKRRDARGAGYETAEVVNVGF